MTPRRLGPYEILAPLGQGGMGEVYRAHDTRLRRDVAIKLLPAELAGDEQRRARLAREARSLAALNHPHVATIHGLEEHDGASFIVMELVEGETLAAVLADGALPLEKGLDVGVQVARALEAAHRQGIVHRDLKPANVALLPDGWVKVLDFGIAKAVAAPTAEDRTAEWPGTAVGVVVGTAAYMSPGQARGEPVDPRSDIFAFGCLLFEVLSGARAFEGASPAEILAAILHEPPRWEALPASLPPDLRRLLARCLEKDLADRFHHIADVRIKLEGILGTGAGGTGTGVGAVTAARREPKPRWTASATWIGAGAVLLLAVLAVGVWWSRGPEAGDTAGAPTSVAVLPFDNLDSGETFEYLELALPDEITTVLTRGRSLAVRPFARNAAAVAGDPAAAARSLGAANLVTGHFAREQENLTVTLEAIDVEDNRLLWRERVTVPASDVRSLREEVARRVESGLMPTLGARPPGDVGTAPASSEAYELYLRSLTVPHEPEATPRAIDLLERAVEQDTSYAPAWAALSRRYYDHGQYGPGGRQAYERAFETVERALDLDPELIPAITQLITMRTETGGVGEAIRQARELVRRRPDSARAHFMLSYPLRYAGLLEEAQRHCDVALALDPSDFYFRTCGHAFLLDAEYDRAERFFELDAGSSWGNHHLAETRLRQDEPEEALRLWRLVPPEDPDRRFMEACLTAESGRALQDPANDLVAANTRTPDPETRYWGASLLTHCGLTSPALDLLEDAVRLGYCSYPGLDRDPLWQPLRNDPEFERIRREAIRCREEFVGGLDG